MDTIHVRKEDVFCSIVCVIGITDLLAEFNTGVNVWRSFQTSPKCVQCKVHFFTSGPSGLCFLVSPSRCPSSEAGTAGGDVSQAGCCVLCFGGCDKQPQREQVHKERERAGGDAPAGGEGSPWGGPWTKHRKDSFSRGAVLKPLHSECSLPTGLRPSSLAFSVFD